MDVRTEAMALEELGSRFLLSAMNLKENQEMLLDANAVLLRKGSIALVPQICVGDKNEDGRYSACRMVTEDMRQGWGMDRSELFRNAADNSRRLFPGELRPLNDFMAASEGVLMPDGTAVPEVFVLTNEGHFNGAAAMFYQPELLRNLSGTLKISELVMMPAGTNEIYCIAVGGKEELLGYQVLFEELMEQAGKEALSDSVMQYDDKSGTVQELGGESWTVDVTETQQRSRAHGR